MKRLTPLDQGFLLMEKRNQPLHIAYLNLLTPPADAPPDFVKRLVERMRSYESPLPPFNQRLENRFGAAWWVDEPEFDIDQHVIHISLPKPGRIRDLLALISRMHSSHLDRAYPLWRTYVIEGLEDGKIATYSKVHHAVADGIAGTRLMLKSMSASAEEIIPPAWALPPRGRRAASGLLSAPVDVASKLAGGARQALSALPGVGRELLRSWRDYRHQDPDFLSGFSAPASILNQRVSASRRFAAQSYSATRVRECGRALGYTLNDIVLGMCGYALRQYLFEIDALPKQPLIAVVPLSTRRDRTESGNQIAFFLANLATDAEDTAERMRRIKNSVDYSKQRFAGLKPAEMLGYSLALLGPGLFNLTANPGGGALPFNLIISNVPGPKGPMYWQGCKLEGLYPVAVVADGLALNITLTSRENWLDFGVIACRRTLPHVQRLLEYLEEGLRDIEALAGTQAAPHARLLARPLVAHA